MGFAITVFGPDGKSHIVEMTLPELAEGLKPTPTQCYPCFTPDCPESQKGESWSPVANDKFSVLVLDTRTEDGDEWDSVRASFTPDDPFDFVEHDLHYDCTNRTRRIVRLSRSVPASEFDTFHAAAAEYFGLDEKHLRLNHPPYFVPTQPTGDDVNEYGTEHFPGKALDVDEVLGLAPEIAPNPFGDPHSLDEIKHHLKARHKSLSTSQETHNIVKGRHIIRILRGDLAAKQDPLEHAVALLDNVPDRSTPGQWVELLTPCLGNELVASKAIYDARQWIEKQNRADDFIVDLKTNKPATRSQKNVDVALMKMGVVVRYDEFSKRDLVSHEGSPFEYIDDALEREIRLRADQFYQFKPTIEFFHDVLKNRAWRNRFHPVVDYLDSLQWDGTERIGSWLVDYAGASDSEYTRAVGRIVLLAAARRVRQPGCKFDEMLILQSPQGTDKSSALKVLAVQDGWFTDDLPLNGDTKRQMEALAGHWIVEAGELKGMRKGEVSDLKGFLSRGVDKARLSYGRRVTEAPRQCIIIGTTNDDTFLRDPTGNRRFWPVEIQGFDLEALRRDRDQLWAEAAHAEATNESIRLDPKLYDAAETEQELRRVEDEFDEILIAAFGLPNSEGSRDGKITSNDLWLLLGLEPAKVTQDQSQRRGAAMKRLSFQKLPQHYKRQTCYVRGEGAAREVRWGTQFQGVTHELVPAMGGDQ